MKKVWLGIIAVALWAVPPLAQANEADAVRAAYNAWTVAIASKKPEAVVKLYEPNARLLSTLDAAPLDTQASRLAYFAQLMRRDELQIKTTEENIVLLDANTALDSGIHAYSYKTANKTVNVIVRYSFVFEKRQTGWMIAHHHSSMLPQ